MLINTEKIKNKINKPDISKPPLLKKKSKIDAAETMIKK